MLWMQNQIGKWKVPSKTSTRGAEKNRKTYTSRDWDLVHGVWVKKLIMSDDRMSPVHVYQEIVDNKPHKGTSQY